MHIKLANPRGFARALIAPLKSSIVRWSFSTSDLCAPRSGTQQICGRRFTLRTRCSFVDELADVPRGSVVIFSAHGVSQAVRAEAAERGLQIFDATCPLVTKGAFGSQPLQW